MKWRNTQLVAIGVVLMLGMAWMALPEFAFAANQAGDSAPNATLGVPNCSYMVHSGDTLFRIAVRYNTNVYGLAALNGLYNPNFIYAGMLLRVPCGGSTYPPVPGDGQPPSGVCSYYLVRPGDYLKSIAARFGTTWQAIAQVNRLYNPNWIYAGMRLAIPCGTIPPPGRTPLTFTSVKHHYVVNYPADWNINVQTPAQQRDPEYVFLRPAAAGLPMVSIYAMKDGPPILGFENCSKNLIFRGVGACSISLPRGQQAAQRLLIFQKGQSYYHIGFQYETQQQLAAFDEIVSSFQFTP